MHLLALQLDLAWHDAATNRAKVARYLEQYQGPLDLLLLPEMFTTGFSMEAARWAEPVDGPTVTWMAEWAEQRQCLIAGSVITEEEGHYYNRFWVLGPGGYRQHYDKRHTFRMAGEHEHYQPGQERVVIEYQGWRILLLICYDLRFPVWSRNRRQGEGLEYDLMLCVANWPQARVAQWEALLVARAIENQCYVAAVNRVGQDGNDLPYSGRSMIIDPRGEPLVAARHQETTLYAELSQERLAYYRQKFPFWLDADAFTIH